MGICETVKIKNGDGYIIINKSDFNKSIHKLYKEKVVEKDPDPTKDDDLKEGDSCEVDGKEGTITMVDGELTCVVEPEDNKEDELTWKQVQEFDRDNIIQLNTKEQLGIDTDSFADTEKGLKNLIKAVCKIYGLKKS